MNLTRRQLLATPSLLLADAPKIIKLEAFPVTYPVTSHFKFFFQTRTPDGHSEAHCRGRDRGVGPERPDSRLELRNP